MSTGRSPTQSIHPHRRLRSHTATVREGVNPVSTSDCFSRQRRRPCRSRSGPRSSWSQPERTERSGREEIKLEVDCVCHGQITPPWSQGICRHLPSTQVCRRRSLFYPGKYDVRPYFPTHHSLSLQLPQQTKANEQAIESLAQRFNTLSASLCTPVPEGDVKEESRRKELEQ